MTELAAITLENEMDLTLAYKKSIRTAELLGLSRSTQTAFATAVSEVCREVIDKAYDGYAALGTDTEAGRFFLVAKVTGKIDEDFNKQNDGIEYARKLVPVLDVTMENEMLDILLKLAIPRNTKVDNKKVLAVKHQLKLEGPISAYEEVKIKNQELNSLNQKHEMALEHARLLDEQKDEFLSVVSHEINSPLTILRSFAQLAVRADKGQNATLTSFLKKIDLQSIKLNNLVQQLLDISKIESGQINYNRQDTDINEFVEELTDSIRVLLPVHELQVSLGKTGIAAMDRLRFEQVLCNMVSNAAKYSEPGSKVCIETSCDGASVTVSVKDEGIGMSKETISNVFNKFYRSENVIRRYSGLGMGLYIASRIITDHNGTINVSSEEGVGSTFSFTLAADTLQAS